MAAMNKSTFVLQFAFFAFAFVAASAEAPATFKVSEFTFTRPTAWEWIKAPR